MHLHKEYNDIEIKALYNLKFDTIRQKESVGSIDGQSQTHIFHVLFSFKLRSHGIRHDKKYHSNE